jgi:predicted lipoprotein with Yx(FWY)xxD motif
VLLIAAATIAVAAAVAGLALAGQGSVIVKAAPSSALHRTIVVDENGRALYHLSGETARHLLCAGSCLRTWPPLTLRSGHTKLVEGRGIQGRLAFFRRPDGRVQVTLRGFPLYGFAGDRVGGQTGGNGIHGSGGVWSLVLARASKLPPIPPPAQIPGPKLPPIPPPV